MRPVRATTVTARPSPRRAHRRLDIGLYVPGGPEAGLAEDLFLTVLVPELVRRGERVTLYDGRRRRDALPGPGVGRVVVARPGGLVPAGGPLGAGGIVHGVATTMQARRRRHDVFVVLHAPAVAAALTLRRDAVPVVYHHDGSVPGGRLALQAARRRVTAVVCDAPATADIHRARAGIDSTVVPWCAPTGGATPRPSVPRAHGVEPGRYLLVADADRPGANLHRIVTLLAGADPALPVVVCGRPGSEASLRARLAKAVPTGITAPNGVAVVTAAPSDRRDLQDLLHHAAVYVHGHGDGTADALLVTAMASGARICALDTVFSRDVLGDAGRYARLEAGGLDRVVADLVHGSAEDDRLLRKKATERATAEFGAEIVADTYRTVLLTAADTPLGRVTVTTRWATPDTATGW